MESYNAGTAANNIKYGNSMLLSRICYGEGKMKKYLYMFPVLMLLVSCTTMATRGNNYVSMHEGLSMDQRLAILKGKVIPGMTPDMVMASWGKPVDVRKEKINGKEFTNWIYETKIDFVIYNYVVRFIGGIVVYEKLADEYQPTYLKYRYRDYMEFDPRIR